jgi:plastocyanin
MQKTLLVAALALVAACGGEQQAQDTMQDTSAAEPGETQAPAMTGTVHDVNMVLEGTSYKFVPATLTIKPGDVVRWHNVSGGPHSVDFWADSIPAGAVPVLNAAMSDKMSDLSGPMMVEPNAVYEVSFAGAPVGEYGYYCLPHLAMGMTAMLTVAE